MAWHCLGLEQLQVHGWASFTWWHHQTETFSSLLAICAGIHRSPVNSPHKGQWRGALMFSLICVEINGSENNREAGDLRRHLAHSDISVMNREHVRNLKDWHLTTKQNGLYFLDNIFKCIFLNKNVWILIMISLKFVPEGPDNNISTLVQIMAWCRKGDDPLSELMKVRLPMHICVTRTQWVKHPIKQRPISIHLCPIIASFLSWYNIKEKHLLPYLHYVWHLAKSPRSY